MTDFFAGINGARFPDVVMNQGPLPGTGGLPKPLHDTADARINYNSTLLGDLEPYAYGEPGYLSSQTAYLNIPHKIQKVIPSLWLPEPMDSTSFRLSHPVDEGDIAFVMRLNRNSEVCTGLNNKSLQRVGLGTAVDPFINLVTLNYILAGLQICTLVEGLRPKWDQLMHHLDSSKFSGRRDQKYDFNSIKHIVENLIRPFGIVHGKDNQGGQSETTTASVQWPVSFVASMLLDGKDADIVNIWHHHDISAGDDMVLRLKAMPLPPGNKYTLNHYRKGTVEKTFPPTVLAQASLNNSKTRGALSGKIKEVDAKITHVWQLVPEIFSLDMEDEQDGINLFKSGLSLYNTMNRAFFNPPEFIPWQHVGYWHIARTQVQSRKYGHVEYYYNDMAMNLRLGHIDSTFQPMFCACSYKAKDLMDCRAKMIANIDDASLNSSDKAFFESYEKKTVILIDSDASKGKATSLRLEQTYQTEPAPKRPKHNNNINSCLNGPTRVSVHPNLLAELPVLDDKQNTMNISTVSSDVNSDNTNNDPGKTEDIGVFDDAGPVKPDSSFAIMTSVQFTVPKPGLKPPARRSAKKGVVSSVLAADGSIRQEQSRML